MRKRSFRFAVIAIGLAVTAGRPSIRGGAIAAADDAGAAAPGQRRQLAGRRIRRRLAALQRAVHPGQADLRGARRRGRRRDVPVTGGNQTAANTVWRSSLGGDYVVTPQMLAGQQPINFSGPTNTPPNVPAAANSPQRRHGSDHDGKFRHCRADNATTAVGLGLVRDCVVGGRPAARSRQRPRSAQARISNSSVQSGHARRVAHEEDSFSVEVDLNDLPRRKKFLAQRSRRRSRRTRLRESSLQCV